MRTYIIRFQGPQASGHAEIVAGTVVDAWEDFKRLHPDYTVLSVHEKPVKTWVGC